VASYAELMEMNGRYAQQIMALERELNLETERGRESRDRCAALHRNTDRPMLRDTFAAAALAGVIAKHGDISIAEAVMNAYRVADAMLEERARKP
jgi:hypothetical protein